MTKLLNMTKRILLFFLGVTIIQFGVALFLRTNIGSDPFTLFTQGLSFLLNTTPGRANMVILICTTIIIILVDRKRIKLGTVICAFGVGPIIDFCLWIASYIPVDSLNIVAKSAILLGGCFVIAVGFSILSATEVGVAPNDIIPFILVDKTKVQYKYVRICLDLSFFILGALFGGVFGVGTIIAMFVTGPFIQFCLPYGEKVVNKLVNVNNEEVETVA